MKKTVRIECEGVKTADIDDFTPLQGDLKTLSDSDYAGLMAEIIEEGFSFSLHVWEQGQTKWIQDGHQRIITLKKMRKDGWEIPPIPYSLVMADNMQQAKRKLLGAASAYGKVNEQGLLMFLKDLEIDPLRLSTNFALPKIDMPKFIELNMSNIVRTSEPPTGAKEYSEESFTTMLHQCPKCGFEFGKSKE